MSGFPGTFAFDEYGRPFIILRDQENTKRITGTDAIKVGPFAPKERLKSESNKKTFSKVYK